jgi:hypothetical protein
MTPTASSVPAVDQQAVAVAKVAAVDSQSAVVAKVAAVDPQVARRRRKKARSRRQAATAGHPVLGRYVADGRLREVFTQPGAAGSVLVVDRDVAGDGEERLVAHLGADEPPGNAALACRDYLRYPSHRWCRRLTAEDLVVAPFGDRPVHHEAEAKGAEDLFGLVANLRRAPAGQKDGEMPAAVDTPALRDRHGCTYRLGPADTGMTIPQLRWLRLSPAGSSGVAEPVGVRDVVGSLEDYEPVRTLTVRALDRHRGDQRVSTYALGAELERLDASRIVLNRGLREAVVAAIASGVSMSEITVRCERLKRGGDGTAAGGDTSWLARRVGLMPEGGRGGRPTPWVHSEVLALIARRGLGVSPREVELG